MAIAWEEQVDHLDTLLRDYVTPEIRKIGGKKSGRTYRIVSSCGDQALLSFSLYPVEAGKTVFEVTVYIVPVSYWDWLNRKHQTMAHKVRKPDSSGALAVSRVVPPVAAAWAPSSEMPFRARWAFSNSDGVGTCGRALQDALRNVAIDQMSRLLDRDVLLGELQDRSSSTVRERMPLDVCEVLLRIDHAPLEEVEELLERIDLSMPVRNEFIEWSRHRVSTRE